MDDMMLLELAPRPSERKRLVRVHLADGIAVFAVDLRRDGVGIFDGICVVGNAVRTAVKVLFQGSEIVGVHDGEHVGHDFLDFDFILFAGIF